MTKSITNELSMQVYGDRKLQEQMVQVLADTFKTEVSIRAEKDYETRSGRTGYYMNISIKLPKK